MRSALCAVLLGGCLIVRTTDEPVDDECPTAAPELLAEAKGPFVVVEAIYFVGANGTLSRVSPAGGRVSELTTGEVLASSFAADASAIYWTTDSAIVRMAVDGSPPLTLAEGYDRLTGLVVDDTSVVWASSMGLDRWSKSDKVVAHLDDNNLILGLGASEGVYYYSATNANRVRRTPPMQDLAEARFPGPLAVDDAGVHYYEAADPFVERAGALRVVPHAGGTVTTTVDGLSPVTDLASDGVSLYFATLYGGQYRIEQIPRVSGNVRTLWCGTYEQEAVRVAVSGDSVYWSEGRGLYRLTKPSLAP